MDRKKKKLIMHRTSGLLMYLLFSLRTWSTVKGQKSAVERRIWKSMCVCICVSIFGELIQAQLEKCKGYDCLKKEYRNRSGRLRESVNDAWLGGDRFLGSLPWCLFLLFSVSIGTVSELFGHAVLRYHIHLILREERNHMN